MLEIQGLTKSFGRLKAVDNISTTVRGGEILGVIGPNGSGKSTLFDLLTGVTRADSGSIRLEKQEISHTTVETRVVLGLARAFQTPKPFASLTVREHLTLAALAGARLTLRSAQAEAEAVMTRTGLGPMSEVLGCKVSLLDRKRLELAKALATRPKVLLLDEVSSGLTEAEVRHLVDLIRGLKGLDLAIIWVEHIAHALADATDRILMLHLGARVIEGTPDDVLADPRVRALYLGTRANA